jgi:hypothetical protein
MHTDITVILDRSGSMASIAEDVVGGLNTFIRDQQTGDGDATFTLVQFDNEYEVVHAGLPMADVPLLKRSDFRPRGTTALLDAIGRTILDVDRRVADAPADRRPARVIVVVQTDGLENASREFTRDKVFELLRAREGATPRADGPAWEFVFLAANQDAIAEGAQMGFRADKAVDFDADGGSVLSMHQMLSAKVLAARHGLELTFDADDRAQVRRPRPPVGT